MSLLCNSKQRTDILHRKEKLSILLAQDSGVFLRFVCLSDLRYYLGTYIHLHSFFKQHFRLEYKSCPEVRPAPSFSYYKEKKHKETKAKATLKVANTMTYLFYVTPNYSQSFMLLFLSVDNWWVQPKSLYLSRSVSYRKVASRSTSQLVTPHVTN